MISQIVGSCTTDGNPDSWYPTVPNGGRPDTILRGMASDINRAISICNSCPKQKECLDEGMKPVNLAHGIWGGLLAGERIVIADEQGVDYLVPPYNKGRVIGPRVRSSEGGKGKGTERIEDTNKITKDERAHALFFAQRIRPYLEV